MMAFEAAASSTSDSEIWPTAEWITFTCTVSFESLMSEPDMASIEPSTSPLTMMFSSLNEPMAMRRPISSSVTCFWVMMPCMRCSCSRLLAISRAERSSSITLKVSPACGAPFRPSTCTGVEGPASSTFLPFSSNIAFTRPV